MVVVVVVAAAAGRMKILIYKKSQINDACEKKRYRVGSKGSRLRNTSGWGGAGGRAEEGP